MVRKSRLSMSRCYECIFIGPAWCEKGNQELERSAAAVMKLIINSIPDSEVLVTDCS
jgi:hypothetical protein